MEITASLSLSELYDPIREMWVAATPEEEVRQRLIALMIHSLGFPRGLLAVERSLDHLCRHLGSHSLPLRRVDLVCFAPVSAAPLLIVECKALPLTESVLAQVRGYNAYVGAPYLAVANLTTLHLFSARGSLGYLPTFQELVAGL